jgi:hypothetical protein
MAWLRKYVDKYTYMLISGIWNATAVYIPLHFSFAPETIIFIVTIGNLVIGWVALETQEEHKIESKI